MERRKAKRLERPRSNDQIVLRRQVDQIILRDRRIFLLLTEEFQFQELQFQTFVLRRLLRVLGLSRWPLGHIVDIDRPSM